MQSIKARSAASRCRRTASWPRRAEPTATWCCGRWTPGRSRRGLAGAGADKTLRLWETATGGELANLEEGHTDAVQGVAFAPSGRQIATAAADKSLGLWSAALPRIFARQTLPVPATSAGVIGVSP